MFDFFVKKKFLVDYLDGFTDIHNHILPGIDDGAKTVDESLGLIKGMGEIGISNFICTPHIMENYYPNTPESIKKSLEVLKKAMKEKNLTDVRISVAGEHMIDSNFEHLLKQQAVMPLDQYYILIEMSYLQASINFEAAVEKIKSQNLFPIFAHPERYVFLQSNLKKYSHYKSQGLLFQLNFLSLSNYYGKEVKKIAFKLIEEGLIDFIASDLHNSNQLENLKNIRLNSNQLKLILPLIERSIGTFK